MRARLCFRRKTRSKALMPTYHRPVFLSCSIVNGEEKGRCRVYMAPGMTTRKRDLVREFLDWSGNSQWKPEYLKQEERRDCGVPDGARVVSFPAQHKDWFYQAFDKFDALLSAGLKQGFARSVSASA